MNIAVRNQTLVTPVTPAHEDRTTAVLQAAKECFYKRNRKLLHSFLPNIPLKDLDVTLTTEWDALTDAERTVYISEVAGSSVQRACPTMINPLLLKVLNTMDGLSPESAISHGDSSAALPSGRRKRKRKNESAPRRAKKPKKNNAECTGVQSTEDVPLEVIDPSDVLSALEAESGAGGLIDGITGDDLDDYLSVLDTVEEQGPTAGLALDNGGSAGGLLCSVSDAHLDDYLSVLYTAEEHGPTAGLALDNGGSAGGLLGGVSDAHLDDYLSFLDTTVEQGPTAGLPGDNGGTEQENSNRCFIIDYNFNAHLNNCFVVDTNGIVL
jgi:hypothetical protein